jgi:hypothetical protein
VTDHVVLMRMAARLMRERAERWSVPGRGGTFHRPAIASPAYEMHVAAVGDPQWSGVADVVVGTGAAPHIASWHPGVALLVADLLEAAAHWEEEWQRDNPGPCDCRPGCGLWLSGSGAG